MTPCQLVIVAKLSETFSASTFLDYPEDYSSTLPWNIGN